MFLFLRDLLIFLLFLNILGYITIVFVEKRNIKRNIILIDNKHLKQEDLNEVDINEFMYKGKKIRAGDEIKIINKDKEQYNGTIIGAKRSNSAIHIITYNNKIKKINANDIIDFKIISKYGKFFNY